MTTLQEQPLADYCNDCHNWKLDCKCPGCLDGRLIRFAEMDCVLRKVDTWPPYMIMRIEYRDHCYYEMPFWGAREWYARYLVEKEES